MFPLVFNAKNHIMYVYHVQNLYAVYKYSIMCINMWKIDHIVHEHIAPAELLFIYVWRAQRRWNNGSSSSSNSTLCTCSSICWCHLPNGVLPQPKQSKFKSETRWILSAAFMCRHKYTHKHTPRPHTFTRRVSEYCAYAQFKFKKTHIHQRNYWATQILRSNFDFIECSS